MIVGGHHEDPFPAATGDKPLQRFRFLARIAGPVRELHDGRRGHAAGFQVTFDQFGNPGVGPQQAPARYNLRRQSRTVQLRREGRAVSRVIIIAQYGDHIRMLCRFVYHPELPCKAHQGMPQRIEEPKKRQEKEQENEPEKNAAVFASPHGFRSSRRRRSAACSGNKALKYTSLML
jgi:hypothetical protein